MTVIRTARTVFTEGQSSLTVIETLWLGEGQIYIYSRQFFVKAVYRGDLFTVGSVLQWGQFYSGVSFTVGTVLQWGQFYK